MFSSFWLERQAFGPAPASHHVVNVCLHVLNALLVWAVLRRLHVRGAYVAALIFAVHPVHVESVAWITERKNVLSGMFYLASLWAYLRFAWPRHDQEPGSESATRGTPRGWYAASLLLFGCALLSKSVTATLPAVLILMQWWTRGRLTARDWTRVAPFFVLGVLAGSGTAWLEVHHVGAAGDEWTLGLVERILLAGRVPWFYAQKLLWPDPLIFIYPRWQVSLSSLQALYPLATLAVLAGLYRLRQRMGTTWANLGNVFYRMDENEAAIAHYRDTVRLDPNLAMAHYNLGLNLLAQRQDDAGLHLRRAFELMPGFAAGYFQVANVQLQQGLVAEAIDGYTAAISAQAGFADAYCNRGAAHLQL